MRHLNALFNRQVLTYTCRSNRQPIPTSAPLPTTPPAAVVFIDRIKQINLLSTASVYGAHHFSSRCNQSHPSPSLRLQSSVNNQSRMVLGHWFILCVCVCFLPSYSGRQACGRTSRGHTGGRTHRISHPPSFCGARLNFSREKDSVVPFPYRP